MEQPCDDCPFVGMSEECKRQAIEPGRPVAMLCHESQSLDGERPDRVCVGFHGESGERGPVMSTRGDDGAWLVVAVWLVLVAIQLSLVGCLIWVAFHFVLKYW